MVLIKSLEQLGQYSLLMKRTFSLPDKWNIFGRRTIQEIIKLGVDSIPLVIVISLFIGAVITIQMQLNVSSPLIPAYSVGLATRDIVLLEFSNSILCLILAGKVGSNIASEIGTMRVTEQIDALDIMGVNSANYLILPKIVAFVAFMPVLVVFCIATSFVGGYFLDGGRFFDLDRHHVLESAHHIVLHLALHHVCRHLYVVAPGLITFRYRYVSERVW